MQKRLLQIHLAALILLGINILVSTITGYVFNSMIMLVVCVAYYSTLLLGCFYLRAINVRLKEKFGMNIGYVLSLSAIFITELLIICISGLYVVFVLLFNMNASVKARGEGYEIRLQPALEWPARYVLYQKNLVLEKQLGDMHANDEDFTIDNTITAVDIKTDSILVSVSGNYRDTVLSFKR